MHAYLFQLTRLFCHPFLFSVTTSRFFVKIVYLDMQGTSDKCNPSSTERWNNERSSWSDWAGTKPCFLQTVASWSWPLMQHLISTDVMLTWKSVRIQCTVKLIVQAVDFAWIALNYFDKSWSTRKLTCSEANVKCPLSLTGWVGSLCDDSI